MRLSEEYTILKRLGKGAFSNVLKVIKKMDDKLYAVKRVKLPKVHNNCKQI